MKQDSVPICLSLTGKTIAANLSLLDSCRSKVDLVELRADCLDPSEKFYLRAFPAKAGLPCILTVRRKSDGGEFDEGEGVRLVMIAKALSYARADASANFAYVDLEEDFRMPTIEEACRTFGTTIIRSKHFVDGMPENLDKAYEDLCQEDDEIPKLVVNPRTGAEMAKLVAWSAALPPRRRLVVGIGDYGYPTSILARKMGSYFAFSSIGTAKAPSMVCGRISPESLETTYRWKETDEGTAMFGLLGGTSILNSLSPALHNTAFASRGKNALLLPLPTDSIEAALDLLATLGAQGAAITVPFKEDVLPYLSFRSTDVQRIGACNTLVLRDGSWAGYNTDADGFERSALEFLGRDSLKGLKATLVGAGGAAKSVALSLYRQGAECVILNRTISTARELAKKYDFSWGHLDDRATDQVAQHSDLIVQATSVGMTGGTPGDPLEFYEFDGHENVLDIVYRPEKTALLERAEAAGCGISNGYKMLRYQAAGQYRRWMGEEPPAGYY